MAAGAEIRFRAPTRAGDELVATAVERSREGRDGTYDVTVTAGETVVATFVGRSREIGGVLWPAAERRTDMAGEIPTLTRAELEELQLGRLRDTLHRRPERRTTGAPSPRPASPRTTCAASPTWPASRS